MDFPEDNISRRTPLTVLRSWRQGLASLLGNKAGRFIIVMLAGVLLFLIARYTIVSLLPEEITLSQEFAFHITNKPATNSAGNFPWGYKNDWRWETFLKHQELDIIHLAHETYPLLAENLIAISDSRWRCFRLFLRFPRGREVLIDDFHSFVNLYALSRQNLEGTFQQADKTAKGSHFQTAMHNWLEDNDARQDQQKQDLVLLQSEYARLRANGIVLEHQLAGVGIPDNSEGFESFLKPHLEKALTQNTDYQQLHRQLEHLGRMSVELDLKAGKCDSAQLLEQLDQRRNQLYRNRQEIQQQITKLQKQLGREAGAKLWTRYQDVLRAEMRRKHELIEANAEKQLAVKMEIDRLTNNHSLILSFLPTSTTPDTTRLHFQRLTSTFVPVLQPLEPGKTGINYSSLQYMVMALAFFVGGGLGWILDLALLEPNVSLGRSPQNAERQGQNQFYEKNSQLHTEKTQQECEPLQVDEMKGETAFDWSRQFDHVADKIEQFRRRVSSPVIVLCGLEAVETSCRVAVNIAAALAGARALRVLLVEVEPERQELAAVFEQAEGPGFHGWRRGELSARQVIVPTVLPNLSFMSAGIASVEQRDPQIDPNKEKQRYSELREQFDVILLNSPAALMNTNGTHEQATAVSVLNLANGLFVQVRPESNEDRTAKKILTLIKGHPAQFLGLITLDI